MELGLHGVPGVSVAALSHGLRGARATVRTAVPSEREKRGLLQSTEPEASRGDAQAVLHGMPAAGDVVAGKYVVEQVLGVGGMGVVLAARHAQLGRRVAIKFMRSEVSRDPNAVERFLREARAAVALGSEHVTKVLDVDTLETGEPYIVMEYLVGTDLGELLRRSGPPPIADAVGALLQACEGMAEAHSLGIVHRDLKPSNLFVTKAIDGAAFVKILDFGISKLIDAGSADVAPNLTSSGSVMGSPGYMSPEQVQSTKDVDARSDVWSLGVILYELLTGVSPFQAQSLGQTFANILSESPAPIRKLRSEVPKGLEAAVSRCLERDVTRRTQTVRELASSLLPFAPPECAALVDRILRLSGGSAPSPARLETQAAPGMAMSSSGPFDPAGTGPDWLRSGTHPPSHARRSSKVMVGLALAALASAAAIGAPYLFGGRTGPGPKPEAPTPSDPSVPRDPRPPTPVGTVPAIGAAPPDPSVLHIPAAETPDAGQTHGPPPGAKRPVISHTAIPSATATSNEKDIY